MAVSAAKPLMADVVLSGRPLPMELDMDPQAQTHFCKARSVPYTM